MADKMTPEQRHRCMSAIHSADTKPELLVRHYLFAHGYRYRVHDKRLPGTPDMVLPKFRSVIFINGCFWHAHDCEAFHFPQTNTDFWHQKLNRNKERDRKERIQLRNMGWHVIQVWECQLKPKVREQTLQAIEQTLCTIYLKDRSLNSYDEISVEMTDKVAEPTEPYSSGL